jgi:serine/threonine protein phosphatase 1
MATIAIGDIHGNRRALDDLLRQITGEVGADDDVVFLGDYIDGGPDAKGCIDAILAFRDSVTANVTCLCGNHEDWLLRTLRDYQRHSWLLGMEPFDTIRSYSVEAASVLRDAAKSAGLPLYLDQCSLPYEAFFDAVPRAHLELFENLPTHHQTADCICVHAGLDPCVPRIQDQTRQALVWGTRDFPRQYSGDDTVVYGHRNNAETDSVGWPHPRVVGRTIGVDTIKHGVLTAIRLPDRQVFQSRRCETHPQGG